MKLGAMNFLKRKLDRIEGKYDSSIEKHSFLKGKWA